MHTRRISDKYSENCQRIRCRTRKVQWQCYAWHSSWNRIIKCQKMQIHSEDTWEMLGNYGTTAAIQLCSSVGLEPKYTNKSIEKIPTNTWNITGLKLWYSYARLGSWKHSLCQVTTKPIQSSSCLSQCDDDDKMMTIMTTLLYTTHVKWVKWAPHHL